MLSELAKQVGLRLREHIGADKKGIGPNTEPLLEMFDDLEPTELLGALDELVSVGFVLILKGIPAKASGTPPEFRDIVGVSVMEALQEYYDDLEL